jgi:hypothetical protein
VLAGTKDIFYAQTPTTEPFTLFSVSNKQPKGGRIVMPSENLALRSPYRTLAHTLRYKRTDESIPARMLLKTLLLPEENVLCSATISEGIFWQSFAFLIFSLVIFLGMLAFGVPFNLMLFLTICLAIKTISMFAIAYSAKYYLLLAVTDKRVLARVGIFNLEVMQMTYAQIESCEVGSTIPGRFFGYSTVFISGTGGSKLAIPYVTRAEILRKTITEIIMRRDEALVHPVVEVTPHPE